MYSGLQTIAQAQAHPRRTEALAQHQVRRASRAQPGRIGADCRADHAHLVSDTNSALADHTVIRWVADIESDGSRLQNLSGRAAAMGDRLSRHDMKHAKFLPEEMHRLSSLTVEDLLDEDEDDGPQPWGLGSHALQVS